MDFFRSCNYLGVTKLTYTFEGISISQTSFPEGFGSNWHYHENPYFTFILEGGSLETRKSRTIDCKPGQLLYYDFDEPHRNLNYQPHSRNINIEFERNWLSKNHFKLRSLGPFEKNSELKFLILRILAEYRIHDSLSKASIKNIVYGFVAESNNANKSTDPKWVAKIYELLNDRWNELPTLEYLAGQLDLHPVTISRCFSKYFKCSLGDYLRRIKVEHSMSLLKKRELTYFDIAMQCGFADSSHFNRVFKSYTGLLPSEFRKL
jgi:AraC family transcriptional regulator